MLVSGRFQERIISIFCLFFYLFIFFRVYYGQQGHLAQPNGCFYTGYALATLETLIVGRIPKLSYRIIFSLIALIARMSRMPFEKNLVPFGFHILWIASKIYFEANREAHNKELFCSRFEFEERLVKFKDLVVKDFPQGVAIMSQEVDRYVFINDKYRDLTQSGLYFNLKSQLDQFFLKQDLSDCLQRFVSTPEAPFSLYNLIQKKFLVEREEASRNQKAVCLVDYKRLNESDSTYQSQVLGVNLMDIVWENQPSIAIFVRDVTEQYAIFSMKMADTQKDNVLATVSHELRTPLNGMLGMIQIMEKKINDSELLNYLSICKNSGNLLLSLVNSILDINQISANKLKIFPEKVNLYSLLMSIVALFEFQCNRKGLYIKIKIGPETPGSVYTDKNRLSQILINLVGNALKFTSKGGITLTADKYSEDLRYVRLGVEDTGIGIKNEDKSKLFRVFGKLENEVEKMNKQGVGLGLSISENLARALCSNETLKGMKLESTYGKGTTFSFLIDAKYGSYSCKGENMLKEDQILLDGVVASDADLNVSQTQFTPSMSEIPLRGMTSSSCFSIPEFLLSENPLMMRPHIYKPTQTMAEISGQSHKKKTILIVDDNPFNLTVAEYMINSLGFKSISALSGNAAVNVLLSHNFDTEPISMILMDCQMPIMDGYETTKMLKEKMGNKEIPEIPIVALTANHNENDKEECRKAGMCDYLTKPLNEVVLRKVVAKFT